MKAMQQLLSARPHLVGISSAAHCLGLKQGQLLHAGPPLINSRQPPLPMRSSIVMTCIYEGWARTEEQAEALLDDGKLELLPAQNHRCVTPLVAVVSPSMPMFEIHDPALELASIYSPVSAVRGIDTRMGSREPGLFERLKYRDSQLVPAVTALITGSGPIALWPLAITGLNAGDDLHSRTNGANEAFVQLLSERALVRSINSSNPDLPIQEALEQEALQAIRATPLFFLTLWMAASAFILRAAELSDLAGIITRAGGNGENFGICLSGQPEKWITCKAVAPMGPLLPHLNSSANTLEILGAAGDSSVIEMLGLGAQRLAQSPEPLQVFTPYLPNDFIGLAERLLQAPQPLLPSSWPLGVNVERIATLGQTPLIMLAMLAANGTTGFAGRGIYRPPLDLFTTACAEISK